MVSTTDQKAKGETDVWKSDLPSLSLLYRLIDGLITYGPDSTEMWTRERYIPGTTDTRKNVLLSLGIEYRSKKKRISKVRGRDEETR